MPVEVGLVGTTAEARTMFKKKLYKKRLKRASNAPRAKRKREFKAPPKQPELSGHGN
jgi:hypothetical protein